MARTISFRNETFLENDISIAVIDRNGQVLSRYSINDALESIYDETPKQDKESITIRDGVDSALDSARHDLFNVYCI